MKKKAKNPRIEPGMVFYLPEWDMIYVADDENVYYLHLDNDGYSPRDFSKSECYVLGDKMLYPGEEADYVILEQYRS